MMHLKSKLVILSGLLSFLFGLSAEAAVYVNVGSGYPAGYKECYIVPAGWYRGAYIPAHRECIYKSGQTWAPGYWSYYGGNWVWVGGHWGGYNHYYYRGGHHGHHGGHHHR